MPLLRKIIRSARSVPNCIHALRALHELGDQREIAPFLKSFGSQKCGFGMELEWLEQTLTDIFPKGPQLQLSWDDRPVDLTTPWLAWLKGHPEFTADAR